MLLGVIWSTTIKDLCVLLLLANLLCIVYCFYCNYIGTTLEQLFVQLLTSIPALQHLGPMQNGTAISCTTGLSIATASPHQIGDSLYYYPVLKYELTLLVIV